MVAFALLSIWTHSPKIINLGLFCWKEQAIIGRVIAFEEHPAGDLAWFS